jgi:sporulation protein YlmC with PRC-barrel domain
MTEERGLVGLEARARDGEEIGRISEVVTDERTGEVTHVVVEIEEDRRMEIPITDLSLDPEADFATFHADPSDEEPGEHVGDAEVPQGYAPVRDLGPEDQPREGQFVAEPEDTAETQSREELDREAGEAGGWEDEGSTPFDSGYPRNDAYIDPDSGQERERYPAQGEDLRSDVEQLLDGTDLRVREVREGVVELEGIVANQEDLEEVLADIAEVDGVLDVDTTDVNVG